MFKHYQLELNFTQQSKKKNKQTKQKKTEPKQGINFPLPECYVLRNDGGKTRSKFFFGAIRFPHIGDA